MSTLWYWLCLLLSSGFRLHDTINIYASTVPLTHNPHRHQNGPKFLKYQQRAARKQLHILQSKIVHCITEREAELSAVHWRVGQAAAQKFLTAINGRWKALELIVREYNKEIDRYNRFVPDRILRTLDAAVLKS